jgi:hypothetical protein
MRTLGSCCPTTDSSVTVAKKIYRQTDMDGTIVCSLLTLQYEEHLNTVTLECDV